MVFRHENPYRADVNSGAVHTVTTTAANVVDIAELPKLLREGGRVIFADAGYTRDEYRRGTRYLGMRWCANDKRKPGKNLSASQKKRSRKQSSVRARVEHIFRVIKQHKAFKRLVIVVWRKNSSQANLLVEPANLYLLGRQLMAA